MKEKLLQINSFKLKKYNFDTVHQHTEHDLAIYENEFDDLMNSYRQKRKKRTQKKSESMIPSEHLVQNTAWNSTNSRNRVNDNDDDRGNDLDMVLNNVSFLTPNPHSLCGTHDFKIKRDIYQYHYSISNQGSGSQLIELINSTSTNSLQIVTLKSRWNFSSASIHFSDSKKLEDRDFILRTV